MKIAEFCAWAGVAPDTPWERLQGVLRGKTLGWTGEDATLPQALEAAEKGRVQAEVRLADLKGKKVPPNSPAWKLAEAECKKWGQRLDVARLLVEVERFQETRTRLDGLIKEGKRNQAKRELDKLEGFARGNPEVFQEQWRDIEAAFLDAFGQAAPGAPPPPSPATPAPPPVPPQPSLVATPPPSAPVTPAPPAAEDLEERMRVGDTVRELRLGRQVFGRYRLEKVIGQGGMGVVWLARDERLDRPVALKFLPEIVRLDASAVKELKRETQRSLELTHPSIVRIYDYVEDTELGAISMEYVDGSTLTTLRAARANDVFDVGELRRWVRELGDALEYAHTRVKVVHRDLKPANLMIDAQGHLKVADFGISRSLSESFSRASMGAGTGGTPMYMSPQQALGERPSVADDVYGFGATLYELLTGKPPFHSGDIGMQLKEKVPPLASERRRELGIGGEPIPGEWDRTIRACLEKDPGKRPSSIRELVERLEARGGVPPAPASPAIAEPAPADLPARASAEAGTSAGAGVLAWAAGLDLSEPPEEPGAAPEPEALTEEGAPAEARSLLQAVGFSRRWWIVVALGSVLLLAFLYWGIHRLWSGTRQAARSKSAALADPKGKAAAIPKPAGAPGFSMDTNRWAWIRPDTFTMGTPTTEQGRRPDEGPQTVVTLTKGFWMGKYEVTQREYQEVMGSNPSYFKGDLNRPVEKIGWYDASNYCQQLTERERQAGRLPAKWEYRLPTEAQWEYACRAGTTTPFSFGDNPADSRMGDYAWYWGNSVRSTHAAGEKLPNPWGLYDMHGNVCEWCLDWYGPSLPGGSVTDPTGPSTGSEHVNRGGSWRRNPQECRSGYRLGDSYRTASGGQMSIYLGFRVVLVAAP